MTELKSTATKDGISNYITSFDGMRGLCCLLVLLVHFRFTHFNLPASIVYIGLHCFFIMSAFLITKNLLRDKEKSANFWQCFKIFYIKRSSRIFPVYFFYLALSLVVVVLLKVFLNNTFGSVFELKHYGAMLLTFTYNFKMWIVLFSHQTDYISNLIYPHLWSLSLEEQFYIVIIFLAWLVNKRTLQILCVIFIIVIPIIRVIGYNWIGTQTDDDHLRTLLMWQSPFFQFDAFFWGITLAVFEYKKSKLYLYLFYIVLAFIFLFGVYNAYDSAIKEGVSFFTTYREDKYFYSNYGYVFMDSLVNIFCVLWFLSVIYYPEKFKFLSGKRIVRFGELTYGLYVFQFLFLPIGLLFGYILHAKLHISGIIAEIAGAIVYIILNFYFSHLVYEKLEVPIIHWKNKILKKVYAQNKDMIHANQ